MLARAHTPRPRARARSAWEEPTSLPSPGEPGAGGRGGRCSPSPAPIRRGRQVPRNAASPSCACSRRSPRLGGHVSPSGSKVQVSRGPANPAEGRGRGEGGAGARGAGGTGGGQEGRGGRWRPLPPALRGRVCEGPGPACRARVSPAHGARRGRGRSSLVAAPAGSSAGGGQGEGRPGGESREAAPPGRCAGRCCWGEKRRRGRGSAQPCGRSALCWYHLSTAQRPLPHLQRRPDCGGRGPLRSGPQKLLKIISLSLSLFFF